MLRLQISTYILTYYSPFYAGIYMKHGILLYALIIIFPLFSMDAPTSKDAAHAKRTHKKSKSIGARFFSCCLSTSESSVFEPYEHQPSEYVTPAPAALPHMPSAQEIKEQHKKDAQRLMELAQHMIKNGENLDSSINFHHYLSKTTILVEAAGHKRRHPILALALAHGANPNLANESGITPLSKTIEHHCVANADYLLQHGATFEQSLLPKLCSPFSDICTPKSVHKRVAMLNLFLQKGADPNAPVPDLQVPAIASILSYLLCNFHFGIDLKSKNKESYALFLEQRKQMITILLQNGLNPFKKDHQGKTEWEKILESRSDFYNEELFDFAQQEVEKLQNR